MSQKILTDEEIINGFRNGNPSIIHDYFYEYCLTGYHIYDQRYQLQGKENLDFYSLAHQYAVYLISHDWKPLENHSPNVSLRTWIINGFRYTVLDALKWYQKTYTDNPLKDYEAINARDNLRLQFNQMIEEICEMAPLTNQERTIIEMNLLKGYKVKEIAAMLHITPSAISQKLKQLKEELITPYFQKYYSPEMEVCMDVEPLAYEYEEEPLISYCRNTKSTTFSESAFYDGLQLCVGETKSYDEDYGKWFDKVSFDRYNKEELPPVWEKILHGEYW